MGLCRRWTGDVGRTRRRADGRREGKGESTERAGGTILNRRDLLRWLSPTTTLLLRGLFLLNRRFCRAPGKFETARATSWGPFRTPPIPSRPSRPRRRATRSNPRRNRARSRRAPPPTDHSFRSPWTTAGARRPRAGCGGWPTPRKTSRTTTSSQGLCRSPTRSTTYRALAWKT